MLKSLFKKETPEQRFEKRFNELFSCLIKVEDVPFTELETVQLSNALRRKLHEYLEEKSSHCMEQATHFNQKANEIKQALTFLE